MENSYMAEIYLRFKLHVEGARLMKYKLVPKRL